MKKTAKKIIKHGDSGSITVLSQEGERLNTIATLARAMEALANAINQGTRVEIKDCKFDGVEVGIQIQDLP